MNFAHLHLMLNHVPVLGSFLITALIIHSIWKRDKLLEQLTFQSMILIGVLSLAAYFTGEPAEEIIEHLPGVSENFISKHENAATYGLIVTEIFAVCGIASLILLRRKSVQALILLKPLLFLGVLDIILMTWIANLGGQIRHTELRATHLVKNQDSTHSEPASESSQPGHEKDD